MQTKYQPVFIVGFTNSNVHSNRLFIVVIVCDCQAPDGWLEKQEQHQVASGRNPREKEQHLGSL